MKKIFAAVAFCAVLTSCDKKAPEEVTDYSVDNVTVPETNEPAPQFAAVEFSPEKITDFVAAKDNDTVYVTNFFATWCGPCIREIPHFREKITELKDQPYKFTFVSLDDKADWPTEVKSFVQQHGIAGETVLLDGMQLSPEFFSKNFKEWDGGSIPFTFIRKGDKTDETVGMMSKEMLDDKINSFK